MKLLFDLNTKDTNCLILMTKLRNSLCASELSYLAIKMPHPQFELDPEPTCSIV